MQKLLAIMILIYLPGSCISYMILFNALIQYVAINFGADEEFSQTMAFRAMVGIPTTIFFYFPLSLKTDMSAFQYGGLASIVALFYVALVMMIELPFYAKQNFESATIYEFYIDWNIFTSCSITFFAYTC